MWGGSPEPPVHEQIEILEFEARKGGAPRRAVLGRCITRNELMSLLGTLASLASRQPELCSENASAGQQVENSLNYDCLGK